MRPYNNNQIRLVMQKLRFHHC